MKKYQHAFTLIEMMVTLSILIVLTTLAAPSFQSFQRSNLLSSYTNTLVAGLHTARNEAIKRNEHTYLAPLEGNWINGWRVYVDKDFDGSYTSGNDITLLEQAALPNQLIISKNGTGNFISFDGSGFPQKTSPLNATLTIQHSGFMSNSDAAAQNSRLIKIAKTGRIRSCKPTSANDSKCLVSQTDPD